MPDETPARQAQASDGEVVLGVDTHKDIHVAAVPTCLEAVLGSGSFATTAAGYREPLAWARASGVLRRAGVERTGSYGAALTWDLLAEDVDVVEANQPDKAAHRRRGKTDALDADAAAPAVRPARGTATAKTGDGRVEARRVLALARDSAVHARTKAINQFKALLVGAAPQLRASLAGLSLTTAALCGTSPVEAPSGKTRRLRLHRGGDRQANTALSRLRWDERTRIYPQRRLSGGRTRREALRRLKRYLAREVFQLLRPPLTAKPVPAAARHP